MSSTSTQDTPGSLRQNPGGIYSQANNFLGLVQSGVDPRTGQFNLAITLPAVPANDLSGPSFASNLAFSPLASQQNRGFGLGWSLLLSELVLNPAAPFLRLSSGEQFAVDWDKSDLSIGGQLVFADHKLKSLQVTRLSNDSFRVDSKSGDIEILKQQDGRGAFVSSELRSPEGRRVFIDWLPFADGDNILSAIRDESRTLLRVQRSSGVVAIQVNSGSASPFTVELWLSNDRLSNVKLPGINSTFSFVYESLGVGAGQNLLFPKEVSGPLGALDSVLWSSASGAHRLPVGAPIEYLPRVTSWIHSAGDPASELYHSYSWIGTRNYLGFGSDAGFAWENSRDNLYKVNKDYDYACEETQRDHTGKVVATITRTWNRFHLQTAETTIRGQTEVKHETRYAIDPDLTWDEQPAYCQLPHAMITHYRNTTAERSEQTEYSYDDYGNVLFTLFPTGVAEISEYHPAGGSNECPDDALSMVRFLRKKRVVPAPSSFETPTLFTCYRYDDLPSLVSGDIPHAVVVEEQGWNETDAQLLEVTLQTYDRTPGPHYGRLATTVTRLNELPTTTRYMYTLENERLGTQITVLGHDFNDADPVSRSTSGDSRSLLTGLTAEETSAAGAVTAYEYDTLGRIVRTVIGKGSAFEAVRTCQYHLDDGFTKEHRRSGLSATVFFEETDASGQSRRSWLDGHGRVVSVELEDLDNAPGTFREISRTAYDALGRASEQTSVEWLPDGQQAFELSTLISYDDWGYVSAVTGPTGVVTHTLHNPVTLRTEQWQQSPSGKCTGKQVTVSNTATSPILQELYDDQGRLVRAIEMMRDGMDRVVEQRIKVAGQPDIVTRYAYDAYSRVIKQMQPDATSIEWTYAKHSDNDHPDSIYVTAPDRKI